MSNELIDYRSKALSYLDSSSTKLTTTQKEEFLDKCVMYNLNPFTREIYAIVYQQWDKDTQSKKAVVQIVVSYLKILEIGQSQPNYGGFDIHYYKDNKEIFTLNPWDNGIVARTTIYQILNNQRVELSNTLVNIDEYKSKNGGISEKSQSFKNQYFTSWCEKIALTNGFRRSYAQSMKGLYIKEEFEKYQQQDQVLEPQKAIAQQDPTPKIIQDVSKDVIKEANQLLNTLNSEQEKQQVAISYFKTTGTNLKDWRKGDIDLDQLRQEIDLFKETQQEKIITGVSNNG